MQPIVELRRVLEELADEDCSIFSVQDLRSVVKGQSYGAFKAMLARANRTGVLERICRGIYLVPWKEAPQGLILFHTAAKLRAHEFNYISLETVLSDAGVISQIPMNWISLMSSGRSHTVDCGRYGHIEFVHTEISPDRLAPHLNYDSRCRLWRASVSLALEDMAKTRRKLDLINMEVVNELI